MRLCIINDRIMAGPSHLPPPRIPLLLPTNNRAMRKHAKAGSSMRIQTSCHSTAAINKHLQGYAQRCIHTSCQSTAATTGTPGYRLNHGNTQLPPVNNCMKRRVSSVVEHSSANPKVPGSIPGPGSWIMMTHVSCILLLE